MIGEGEDDCMVGGDQCDHGVVFDYERVKSDSLSSSAVRKLYPRLDGKCPKRCGYVGIAYASFLHYLSGDW